MKNTAEANLGHEVKRAVITVPAYFNDAQRRATQTAAAIAGLKVERIINEPTAAALAYGLDKQSEGNVLVFDLGGGTFDVSLLQIEGGVFKVLSTAGDTHLGGEDFDAAMQDHMVGVLKKQNGGKDIISDNSRALRQLRNACERAKRMLSSTVSADVEVSVGGEDLSASISRATFEKLNAPLFEKCLNSVKRVLDDAKVNKDAIDQIVLVGGSTRIPKVQELLQEFFNGKPLCKSVNPDEAVAYGAAVQGAVLSGIRDETMNSLILVDVNPLTLGIETEGRVFAKVVPRNTSVPCNRTREFTTVEDYQPSVDVKVYEGERSITDGNHLLGEFVISGIERAKKGVPKIDVTFQINVSGLLTVTACDQATGAKANITIENDIGRHSQEEVDRMIAEAERLREEDASRVKEVEEELGIDAED
jgi:L1 cell adhesion molecule like protein